jgi:anti-sigma B factor antagonist
MIDLTDLSMAGVTTSQHEGVVVAVVNGDLDMVSVDRIGAVLSDQVNATPLGLVVDLDVTFLASSGLSMLLKLRRRAARRGVEFTVVPTSKPAERCMTLSGLGQLIPMTDSLDNALALVQRTRRPR